MLVSLRVAVGADAPLDVDEVLACSSDRVAREHIVNVRILQQKRGHDEGHHLRREQRGEIVQEIVRGNRQLLTKAVGVALV